MQDNQQRDVAQSLSAETIGATLYFTFGEGADVGSGVEVHVATGKIDGGQAYDDMARLCEAESVCYQGAYLQVGSHRFELQQEPDFMFRVIDIHAFKRVAAWKVSEPEKRTGRDLLLQALHRLTRPSGIPGMDGTPVPDPIAQELLATPGLASVAAELSAHGVKSLRPLGYGASSVVLDAGDGRVVRLGVGPLTQVPAIPEMMQPLASGTAGLVRFELIPRAETAGMTEADVRDVAARLAQRGYEFSDMGADNIGRFEGRVVVIDPGAVKAVLRHGCELEGARAASGPLAGEWTASSEPGI